MGKEITHVCDGCDKRFTGDDRPSMWKRVRVSVENEIDPNAPSQRLFLGYFDLCEVCVSSLEDKADPSKWPRNEAAT